MKILELRAENFKKLRVVEIRPDGNMVPITGRNGQGKTSVLDAIWFALKGKKALPMKAVRKGTERMKVSLETEDFTVTRTLTRDGQLPTINLEMKSGKKREATPQEFLDDVIGELTFDPLEFLRMGKADQVAMLRRAAKVEIDFAKLDEESAADYEARKEINRDIAQLDGQIKGITVLDGLPKEKLDEAEILGKLENASAANEAARRTDQGRSDLGAAASRLGADVIAARRRVDESTIRIQQLERELRSEKEKGKHLEEALTNAQRLHKEAEQRYQQAPAGEFVDVGGLTQELAAAQRTNRAIDARNQWEDLRKKRDAKQRESDKLTRQMEAREEKKREAISAAKLPIDGATFDENQVLFNGLPLENLGEGEQIRISTELGMMANPKLRVLCIRHGEGLDEEGLGLIAKLAEANDFQVWMTRVDSTGKVGIVLEDGMIVGREEA